MIVKHKAKPLKKLVKPFGTPPDTAVLMHEEPDGSSAVYWIPVRQRPEHAAFKPVRFPRDTDQRKDVVAGTNYVADYATNEVQCLITTLPESGTQIAWDMCSACQRHFSVCICEALTPPHYILKWRVNSGQDYPEPERTNSGKRLRKE